MLITYIDQSQGQFVQKTENTALRKNRLISGRLEPTSHENSHKSQLATTLNFFCLVLTMNDFIMLKKLRTNVSYKQSENIFTML